MLQFFKKLKKGISISPKPVVAKPQKGPSIDEEINSLNNALKARQKALRPDLY